MNCYFNMIRILIALILISLSLKAEVILPDTTVSRGDIIMYPIILQDGEEIFAENLQAELVIDYSMHDLKSVRVNGVELNESDYLIERIDDELILASLTIDTQIDQIQDTLIELELEILASFKDSTAVELRSLLFDNVEFLQNPIYGSFLVDRPVQLNTATFLSSPYPNPHRGEFQYDLTVFEDTKFDMMFEDVVGRKSYKFCDCSSDPATIDIVGDENRYKRNEIVPPGNYKLIVNMNTNYMSAGLYRVFIKADSFMYSNLIMYNK